MKEEVVHLKVWIDADAVKRNEDLIELQDFVTMLNRHNISFYTEKTEKKVKGEKDKYGFPSTTLDVPTITTIILTAVTVELTKEAVQAIFNWFKERRKIRGSLLRVHIERGDVLSLNVKERKALADILGITYKELYYRSLRARKQRL